MQNARVLYNNQRSKLKTERMFFVSEGKINKSRREDDKQVGEMMRERFSREYVGERTDTATCMLQ